MTGIARGGEICPCLVHPPPERHRHFSVWQHFRQDFSIKNSLYFLLIRLYDVFCSPRHGRVKKIRHIDIEDIMKKIAYEDNKNVIHARLRYYRKLQGLTQGQVAAKLQVLNVNMDQQMLSKIEHNRRIVTDYELACLCKVLNVTERDLLADFYGTGG